MNWARKRNRKAFLSFKSGLFVVVGLFFSLFKPSNTLALVTFMSPFKRVLNSRSLQKFQCTKLRVHNASWIYIYSIVIWQEQLRCKKSRCTHDATDVLLFCSWTDCTSCYIMGTSRCWLFWGSSCSMVWDAGCLSVSDVHNSFSYDVSEIQQYVVMLSSWKKREKVYYLLYYIN